MPAQVSLAAPAKRETPFIALKPGVLFRRRPLGHGAWGIGKTDNGETDPQWIGERPLRAAQ